MREVEVKVRIKDLPALESKLTELGVELPEPVLQDDAIYFDGEKEFNERQKCNFVRIRRTEHGAKLTLKRSIEDELDSLEHETPVSDPNEAEAIVKELGLKFGVRVVKHRREFKWDNITGCVDSVEGLGDFLELEMLVEDNRPLQEVRQELRQKLADFGLGSAEEVSQGYDTMTYELQRKV